MCRLILRRLKAGKIRSATALFMSLLVMLQVKDPTAADTHGSKYVAKGHCGPYPRAQIRTPGWACVGIVAGPAQGLIMPRNIVEVVPGRFIITDMGSWSPGRGRVFQLDLVPKNAPRVAVLYDKLDVVHGLAFGSDSHVYIGERGRIWRFDPKIPNAPKELVVSELPSTGLHRLKHIIFDNNGDLLINVGAPTDRCEGPTRSVQWPCPSERLPRPLGAVWRLRLADHHLDTLALGLRNSMAIAVHRVSGLILQAENSADYPDGGFPPDELNILGEGKHYGWPYCVGYGTAIPEYRRHGIDCSRYTNATALLPAHSAPLGMLFYTGTLFPELSHKLIISYHGHRSTGHRIVAAVTDSTGRPQTVPGGVSLMASELVGPWAAERGIRPMGSPVGLMIAADGSLWFVEDKNRTVMVVLRSGPSDQIAEPKEPVQTSAGTRKSLLPSAINGWSQFYSDVIRAACAPCHEEFRTRDADHALQLALERGWLDVDDLPASKLFQSIRGANGVRLMPPPPANLRHGAQEALRRFLRDLPERSSIPRERGMPLVNGIPADDEK